MKNNIFFTSEMSNIGSERIAKLDKSITNEKLARGIQFNSSII